MCTILVNRLELGKLTALDMTQVCVCVRGAVGGGGGGGGAGADPELFNMHFKISDWSSRIIQMGSKFLTEFDFISEFMMGF